MSVRLVVLSLLALSLAACDSIAFYGGSPPNAPAPGSPNPGAPTSEPWGEMLAAVNAARAQGAPCGTTFYPATGPLAWNAQLEEAARTHSQDMAANDHFAHTGTDGSKPGDRVEDAGYAWEAVGENIARYQPTVQAVVADWMASPSHCRQILDPAYDEMGAAEADLYWVQVFAAPL